VNILYDVDIYIYIHHKLRTLRRVCVIQQILRKPKKQFVLKIRYGWLTNFSCFSFFRWWSCIGYRAFIPIDPPSREREREIHGRAHLLRKAHLLKEGVIAEEGALAKKVELAEEGAFTRGGCTC
jgi:hypothetical protein